MSCFFSHAVFDRALDAVARESRHIRRHRLGAWRPGRCDPRPPPRRVLPLFRLLGRVKGVLIGATFYPQDGPGPPADAAVVPCPFCAAPIQIWPAEDSLRAVAQSGAPETVLIPARD